MPLFLFEPNRRTSLLVFTALVLSCIFAIYG